LSGNALRYGLYLPAFGPFGDPAALVDLALRAEDSGWDGVFLWDHLVHDALPIADPWTTLAAIAQATRDLRFGPMVTPLPRRRPWVVARHASALSRLSGGRLILGTGLGSDEFGDLSRFGEPTSLPALSAMYDEGLGVVRGVWSGRPFRHDGQHYHVTLGEGVPDPHPIPVWVASLTGHPRVMRRAAGSDGIFPIRENRILAPDEVAGLLMELRRAGLPEGRAFDIAVAGNASPAWQEPVTADLAGLAQAGMTWWMESLIHFDPLELSLEIVDAGPPRV
jgi:alkanesulfonate monooxygenase SsuD/methylene tetrahydromethanopterin reductase-like flavin-dependent oxidoreductase (luciferase family)